MNVHQLPTKRAWQNSRFDQQDSEPLGPLANLLDLMLVFACGLIAALISLSNSVEAHFRNKLTEPLSSQQIVEKGRELPQLPNQGQSSGDGYIPVGQVYRDPETGKLILIGE
ncbi:MAG: DUF2149 domain-containing protein [Pseudomonadota bacterium]